MHPWSCFSTWHFELGKTVGSQVPELLIVVAPCDRQLSEGFWQHGRVAMTREARPTARTAGMAVLATRPLAAARPRALRAATATATADSTGVALLRAQAWRVRDCWVSPEEVLRMPRIDR